MSEKTASKLRRLALRASSADRKISPMQVAAQLLGRRSRPGAMNEACPGVGVNPGGPGPSRHSCRRLRGHICSLHASQLRWFFVPLSPINPRRSCALVEWTIQTANHTSRWTPRSALLILGSFVLGAQLSEYIKTTCNYSLIM